MNPSETDMVLTKGSKIQAGYMSTDTEHTVVEGFFHGYFNLGGNVCLHIEGTKHSMGAREHMGERPQEHLLLPAIRIIVLQVIELAVVEGDRKETDVSVG